MLRRRTAAVLAAALAAPLALPAAASAQVVDTLVGTTTGGLLTMTGVGVNVALSTSPGAWSNSVGATALTVSDLTASDNGWRVTATYSDPATGTGFGGANVRVSSAYDSGPITGSSLNLVTNAPLDTPVVVAKPTTGGGGVTVLTTSYQVRVPETAVLADTFGGTVTYTVQAGRG